MKWPDEHNKTVIKRWWDDSARHVQTEIDLALLTNRIYLRWTPTKTSRHFSKFEKKVRGVYKAIVVTEDGKESKAVSVVPEWVHQNFTHECL